MYYIGFDIGGSSVKAVLVDKNKIIGTRFERLPKSYEQLVNVIIGIKNDFIIPVGPNKIKGIGFSVPGPLDKKREKVLLGPNIPYLTGQPILKMFRNKLKPFDIKIEHDINCHLLAEIEIGMAKKYKNIFYIALGTGIGAALMANGNFIYGSHGSAGEFGHNVMDLEKGIILEKVAACKYIHRKLGLSFSEAKEKAIEGNKKAIRVFDFIGNNLGVGIANVINTFDPEVIIISGGMAKARKFIQPGIVKGVKKYVISPEAKKTKILWSKLGRFGGALGAALLVESHKVTKLKSKKPRYKKQGTRYKK